MSMTWQDGEPATKPQSFGDAGNYEDGRKISTKKPKRAVTLHVEQWRRRLTHKNKKNSKSLLIIILHADQDFFHQVE